MTDIKTCTLELNNLDIYIIAVGLTITKKMMGMESIKPEMPVLETLMYEKGVHELLLKLLPHMGRETLDMAVAENLIPSGDLNPGPRLKVVDPK